MLDRATTRALPLVNRVAGLAPAATGCCNACRTCVTTNAVGVLALVFAPVARFVRRLMRTS